MFGFIHLSMVTTLVHYCSVPSELVQFSKQQQQQHILQTVEIYNIYTKGSLYILIIGKFTIRV